LQPVRFVAAVAELGSLGEEMNPWLKTCIVAAIIPAVVCAIPYLLGLTGDAHMGNSIPIFGALVCAAALAPSLLVSWCWHRWLTKKKSYGVVVLIAAVMSAVLFSLISRPMLGVWFWRVSLAIGIYPAVFCGIPLVYLWLCRKPNEKTA